MNNGNEFIESVCNRLRAKGTMVHDSDIVSEISRMRWDEIKEMCAAEQPNNGMELTSALPTVDCPAYFQGKVCPLKPSLISHCDTSPCKVVIANWLPKSGVGA